MNLRDKFLVFIKGAIIGIANIIPGVSGGTLAVSLGIYEDLLLAISSLFKNFKKSMGVLLPILLGAICGILSTSKLVSFALGKFKAQTIFLFVGLIVGGISLIRKKINSAKKCYINYLIFILVFLFVIGLNYLIPSFNNIDLENMTFIKALLLVLMGILSSGAMIIPGISGSFLLMLFGFYEPIINTISSLTNFKLLGSNLLVLLPFGIGIIIGILSISKFMSYLLKKYEVRTYYGIMGFVLSSIVILILNIGTFTYNFNNIFTCLLMFLWGYILARNLEKEKGK